MILQNENTEVFDVVDTPSYKTWLLNLINSENLSEEMCKKWCENSNSITPPTFPKDESLTYKEKILTFFKNSSEEDGKETLIYWLIIIQDPILNILAVISLIL